MQHRQYTDVADLGPVIAAEAAARVGRVLTALDVDDAQLLLRCLRPRIARSIRLSWRDEAIRQTAHRFWPNLTLTGRAIELSLALRRYAAAGWRHDRAAGPPAQVFAAALHRLLVLNGGRVLGHRRLITILTDELRVMH